MWFDQMGRVLQLKQEVMYRAFNRNGILRIYSGEYFIRMFFSVSGELGF
jgi:hypothetical protein